MPLSNDMTAESIVAIVPIYNRRHTILDTLDGIAAQTVLPDRLIVVDDGSTDGGAQVVRQWIDDSGARLDCRLVVQTNRGVSTARNRGLAVAGECQYIAFLDSDDVWPRDFLERTRARLSSNPQAVAATSDRQFDCCDGEPSRRVDSSRLPDNPCLWMLLHGADIASATLFRAAAIRRRGGFDPALRTGEDSALFLPLSLDGAWLHAPGEPVTYRRGLAASLGDAGNLTASFRDNRRIWANVYENFFVHGGGQKLLNNHQCKRLLALAWFQAGQELLAHRAPREALACFRRSMVWNPWRARYRGWAMRAWLATLSRSPEARRLARRGLATRNDVALAR